MAETVIATAAVQNLLGGSEVVSRCDKPEIMADAAYNVLISPSRECTGNFFIDEIGYATRVSPISSSTQSRRGAS